MFNRTHTNCELSYRAVCALLTCVSTGTASQAHVHVVNDVEELLDHRNLSIRLYTNFLRNEWKKHKFRNEMNRGIRTENWKTSRRETQCCDLHAGLKQKWTGNGDGEIEKYVSASNHTSKGNWNWQAFRPQYGYSRRFIHSLSCFFVFSRFPLCFLCIFILWCSFIAVVFMCAQATTVAVFSSLARNFLTIPHVRHLHTVYEYNNGSNGMLLFVRIDTVLWVLIECDAGCCHIIPTHV